MTRRSAWYSTTRYSAAAFLSLFLLAPVPLSAGTTTEPSAISRQALDKRFHEFRQTLRTKLSDPPDSASLAIWAYNGTHAQAHTPDSALRQWQAQTHDAIKKNLGNYPSLTELAKAIRTERIRIEQPDVFSYLDWSRDAELAHAINIMAYPHTLRKAGKTKPKYETHPFNVSDLAAQVLGADKYSFSPLVQLLGLTHDFFDEGLFPSLAHRSFAQNALSFFDLTTLERYSPAEKKCAAVVCGEKALNQVFPAVSIPGLPTDSDPGSVGTGIIYLTEPDIDLADTSAFRELMPARPYLQNKAIRAGYFAEHLKKGGAVVAMTKMMDILANLHPEYKFRDRRFTALHTTEDKPGSSLEPIEQRDLARLGNTLAEELVVMFATRLFSANQLAQIPGVPPEALDAIIEVTAHELHSEPVVTLLSQTPSKRSTGQRLVTRTITTLETIQAFYEINQQTFAAGVAAYQRDLASWREDIATDSP